MAITPAHIVAFASAANGIANLVSAASNLTSDNDGQTPSGP